MVETVVVVEVVVEVDADEVVTVVDEGKDGVGINEDDDNDEDDDDCDLGCWHLVDLDPVLQLSLNDFTVQIESSLLLTSLLLTKPLNPSSGS